MCLQFKAAESPDEEMNRKSIMESSLVLLWSFNDTLTPKLELESSREVTCLSFCPYDEHVLIGGTVNGQLIIWDLRNRLDAVEKPEALSEKQEKNRRIIYSFMNWSNTDINQKRLVRPAATTSMEVSHKKAVTSIKWLNRKHFIAPTGQVQESAKPSELYRQFVTASLDGTISFWDLDYIDPNEAQPKKIKRKYTLPENMVDDVSEYARLNGVIQPIYTVAYGKPISSLIFDEGCFR